MKSAEGDSSSLEKSIRYQVGQIRLCETALYPKFSRRQGSAFQFLSVGDKSLQTACLLRRSRPLTKLSVIITPVAQVMCNW